jgi:DNA-binding winged helix-turn-helix (wHTH) protein/TolB-like protein
MPRFLFGPFEFDSATLDLRRDGAPVRLQSQPAQVLKSLLEHTDQIVSRDDLRKSIWGDSTFVDFESGLNFCISQLRSALRDDASQPLYIRTVPKKGYQFIAPVRQLEAPAPDTAAIPAPPHRLLSSRFAIPLVLALLAGLAGALFLLRPKHNPPPIVAVARFDNETGDAALDSFTDNVTDEVVEQLTARGANTYRVIGNAKILFPARVDRDLRTIASSLNASYIVLGQVQSSGGQIRILAHLIRASDQTHIWVVRIEGPASGMPQLDTKAAGQIAATFSSRLADNPDKAGSFQPGNH